VVAWWGVRFFSPWYWEAAHHGAQSESDFVDSMAATTGKTACERLVDRCILPKEAAAAASGFFILLKEKHPPQVGRNLRRAE
jgi:hypothetical protein